MSGYSVEDFDALFSAGGQEVEVSPPAARSGGGLREELVEAGMTLAGAASLQRSLEWGMGVEDALRVGVTFMAVRPERVASSVAHRVRGILEGRERAQAREQWGDDSGMRAQLREALSAAQGRAVSEVEAEAALDVIRQAAIREGLSRPYFNTRVHQEISRLQEVAVSRLARSTGTRRATQGAIREMTRGPIRRNR